MTIDTVGPDRAHARQETLLTQALTLLHRAVEMDCGKTCATCRAIDAAWEVVKDARNLSRKTGAP